MQWHPHRTEEADFSLTNHCLCPPSSLTYNTIRCLFCTTRGQYDTRVHLSTDHLLHLSELCVFPPLFVCVCGFLTLTHICFLMKQPHRWDHDAFQGTTVSFGVAHFSIVWHSLFALLFRDTTEARWKFFFSTGLHISPKKKDPNTDSWMVHYFISHGSVFLLYCVDTKAN